MVYHGEVIFYMLQSTLDEAAVADLDFLFDLSLDDGERDVADLDDISGSSVVTRAKEICECLHQVQAVRREAILNLFQNVLELLADLAWEPAAVPRLVACSSTGVQCELQLQCSALRPEVDQIWCQSNASESKLLENLSEFRPTLKKSKSR